MKRRLGKGLAVLLALAMLLSMIPAMALAANYDTQMTITIDDVSVNAGDTTVYVPVIAEVNPGIAAMNLTFTFDEDVLTLTDIVNELPNGDEGKFTRGTFLPNPAYALVVWGQVTNYTGTGILFWLVFDVAADAVTQDCFISVGITDDDPGSFVNASTDFVGLNGNYGTVSVTGAPVVPTKYSVSFPGLPENANIMFATGSGQPITAASHGVYLVEPGSYMYLIYPDWPDFTVELNDWVTVVDEDVILDLFSTTEPEPDPTLWNGTIDTSWYNSTDTSFTLTTAAQFAGFAAIVNNKPGTSAAGAVTGTNTSIPADDFLGKTVTLATDVDLGGIEEVAGSIGTIGVNAYTVPVWSGLLWTPIGVTVGATGSNDGTTGRPFKGVFDGGFHSISNMRVNTGTDSAGLFAELGQVGLVKNVVVKSGYVQGVRYAAGIVGRSWGKIDSCANYASVNTSGDRSGGGIAGVLYNNGNYPTLRNSFNAGTIYKGDRRWGGGIVGDSEGLIENCFNIGTGISKFTPWDVIGGIDGGGHSSSGTITNCYSITGTGYPTVLTAARPAGTPAGAMLTAAEMKTNAFALALGSAFNMDTDGINGGFPILAGMGGTPAVAPATITEIVINSTAVKKAYIAGESFNAAGIVITANYSDDTSVAVTEYTISNTAALTTGDTSITISGSFGGENFSFVIDITVTTPPPAGLWDGTIDTSWYNSTDTSFTITTAAQFAGFAAIVNNKPANSNAGRVTGSNSSIPADDFLGKTVTLAVDLDLGGIETSAGSLAGTTYTRPVWTGLAWTPIGTYTGSNATESNNGERGRPFKGTFDGGFHTISNVYIKGNNSAGYDDIADNSHALFGDLGHDGTVKNVVLASGYIRGDRFTAGIAGRNWGHVEFCANYATIETDGGRSGGGIAGVNYENTPSDSHKPWVKNSFNAGLVMAGDQAYGGGIVNDNEGIVENCFNIGTGARKTSMGTKIGGIVGGDRGVGTVINCYSITGAGYPTLLVATQNTPPAGTMLAAAEMQTNDFVWQLGSAFNLDTDNINGGFPILAGMGGTPATEPVAPVDKSALEALLTKIITGEISLVEEDYTAESWAAAAEAGDAAMAVYQDDDATQEEVDTALANLLAAIEALELAPPVVVSAYAVSLVTDDTAIINAGETFTVDVVITGDGSIKGFDATINTGGTASFVSAATALTGGLFSASKGKLVFTGTAGISMTDGVVVATVTLKANSDISAEDLAEITVDSANVVVVGTVGSNQAEAGAAVEIPLYNLTVTFEGGDNATVAGDATAYVKYGEAGLFTDNTYTEEFTLPTAEAAEGYRLADPVWLYTDGMTFTENAAFEAQTIKTWNVSFYDAGGVQIGETQIIDEGGFAAAPADPTAENMNFEGWFIVAEPGDSYVGETLYSADAIAENDVTADVIYKAYLVGTRFEITIPDGVNVLTGVTDEDDGKSYVQYNTDVTFELTDDAVPAGYVPVVSVKIGDTTNVLVVGDDGVYTIPGADINGEVEIIISQKVDGEISFISFDDFIGAPEGYKVMLFEVSEDYGTYLFDGELMFWSEKYPPAQGTGAFAYMVPVDMTEEEAFALITIVTEDDMDNISIKYDGDVFADGKFNVADAQIAMDLYCGDPAFMSGFVPMTMLMRFEADINADGTIDMTDVQILQGIIIGLFD